MMVIGGCRSGKSAYALDHCNQYFGKHKYFLATSVPMDAEMAHRVNKHQLDRGKDWNTIEEPAALLEAIQKISPRADIVLVDCLTLWVSNLMARDIDQDRIILEARNLCDRLKDLACSVAFVSNEVGSGIVPENSLARRFRDTAGMVNQVMAAHVDEVIYMVSGIPMQIKPCPVHV